MPDFLAEVGAGVATALFLAVIFWIVSPGGFGVALLFVVIVSLITGHWLIAFGAIIALVAIGAGLLGKEFLKKE
ncbi:hypothetical protein [Bradyrhizobium liaoningense]